MSIDVYYNTFNLLQSSCTAQLLVQAKVCFYKKEQLNLYFNTIKKNTSIYHRVSSVLTNLLPTKTNKKRGLYTVKKQLKIGLQYKPLQTLLLDL